MPAGLTHPDIETPEGDSARLARHPRIRVAQVAMDYLVHGWSAEEMARQHPGLSPAEAHAAMTYYWDRQDEFDREIRDEADQAQRERIASPPTWLIERIRESKTARI